MTQEEINSKLEQAAYNDTGGYYEQQAFTRGAQTILDNPQEWGLQDIEDSDERWCEVVDSFKQERDHYRRALEHIVSHHKILGRDCEGLAYDLSEIAKKALKQEEQ